MGVDWITAFVDRPAHCFAETAAFWAAVSGSAVSSWRGTDDEFATLLPSDGADAHLRTQRTESESGGSHIDLHVADVGHGVEECTAAGARVLDERDGYTVLASPGEMPFCVVRHKGEQTRQAPVVTGASGTATLVDQISIDVDPGRFDEEVRFWSSLTGWTPTGARRPEFVPLEHRPSMSFRLMLQKRTESSGVTTCHLDIACEDMPLSVNDHESLGASVGARAKYWTVMADPSGTQYCLTRRQPATGQL